MDSLSAASKTKAEYLVGLGLPEVQAVRSAKALEERPSMPTPAGVSAFVYYVVKANDGCDMSRLTANFDAYFAEAKKVPGKVHSGATMVNGEMIFFEAYDSPSAMDCHIGLCFPHYVKMLADATMTELLCVSQPKDLEFWKVSTSAWGATRFAVVPALALDAKVPMHESTVEFLTGLGLPEAQAKLSVDATAAKPSAPKPTTAPTYCFYTLKLQEGADKPAITEAMKSYCTAAKASLGKLDGCYGMTESELVFFDVMDSPLAMDIHIGNCFPHYIKMLAGSKMCDLVNIVDPKNVAWWKESTAVWGAEKHIVSPPGSGDKKTPAGCCEIM